MADIPDESTPESPDMVDEWAYMEIIKAWLVSPRALLISGYYRVIFLTRWALGVNHCKVF